MIVVFIKFYADLLHRTNAPSHVPLVIQTINKRFPLFFLFGSTKHSLL